MQPSRNVAEKSTFRNADVVAILSSVLRKLGYLPIRHESVPHHQLISMVKETGKATTTAAVGTSSHGK
jgi:hypothetical protein